MATKRHMGWGPEGIEPRVQLAKEEKQYDVILASAPAGRYMEFVQFASSKRRQRAFAIPPEVREKFKFDSGFAFWVPEQMVYGKDVEPGPQERGTCVGTSHVELLASRIAVEILIEQQPEQPLGLGMAVCPYEPYSYGVGRCNRSGSLGSPRIRGDGSNCSWQINATMTHGFLPSNLEGLVGPPPGSTSSVQGSWGNNSGGVLRKWRPKAIEFDLATSVRVRNGNEAWTALTEILTPIQICSGQGFAYKGWDSKYQIGLYKFSGSWSHSMQLIAGMEIKGERFCVVRNQWGRKAHKDCGRGIPLGSFAITWATLERWLPNAYAATIGEIKGKQFSKFLREAARWA
jgi:hypothetical protein